MDNETKSVLSSVRLIHCVFDELKFLRKGFSNQSNPQTDQFQFSRSINKDNDGAYRVSLAVQVCREDEFELSIRITGYFEIDENDPNKEVLLEKNAVAILFPFLRAEITLLTAQPEMTPIVMPAINITALFDNAKEIESKEIE